MSAHFVCGPGAYRKDDRTHGCPQTIIGHRRFRARIRMGVRAGWKHREVTPNECNARTPQLLAHKP